MPQHQPHHLVAEVDLGAGGRPVPLDREHPAQPVPLMVDPVPGLHLGGAAQLPLPGAAMRPPDMRPTRPRRGKYGAAGVTWDAAVPILACNDPPR